jgi:hypothetical protein
MRRKTCSSLRSGITYRRKNRTDFHGRRLFAGVHFSAHWKCEPVEGECRPANKCFILKSPMKLVGSTLLLLFLAAQGLFAADTQYQSAIVTDVQQKTNTRVLYYVVNTPVTKDEPYYEISVRLKDTVYLGRYTPRHARDTLPPEWVPNATIEARVEGRHLFVKRPSGDDVDFAIVKKTKASSGDTSAKPAPSGK